MIVVVRLGASINAVANDTFKDASAGNVAARAVYLGLFLVGLWLLLSGHYVTLILALGFLSCVLAVAIALRMDIVGRETHPVHLHPRVLLYGIWLVWEITKANFDVARRILDPRLPISPNLLRIKATQESDLGRASYANSITLTPGTVCIGVEGDTIEVHALTEEAAEALSTGEMDRRVTKIETLF